ncbi:nicotinate-nucleotide adenylyltransferase [Thiosulfativibrio zosterae]|uniref:nicotinate-nucleotide adenylyltransferase n=1 Tax=Thiosulfativibrio zosterae TaxID=2675053 RepID=UPI001566B89D|nr:nicotinate-nucleotide adenylyltransferase [Thiosulfativibrio zosterae]
MLAIIAKSGREDFGKLNAFSGQYIGINGGTFDPIHFGHLRPALEVQLALGLEEVRFIPCYKPVHRDQPSVSAEHRCAMIALAIASQPKFVLDKVEIEQGGPSYMVHTLQTLTKRYPAKGLVLMMGTDAFAKFDTWFEWQTILKLANLAITHRPGEPIPQSGEVGQLFKKSWVPKLTEPFGQIVDVPITQLELSATALRSYLKQGVCVDYLLPSPVINYIQQHQLYQE